MRRVENQFKRHPSFCCSCTYSIHSFNCHTSSGEEFTFLIRIVCHGGSQYSDFCSELYGYPTNCSGPMLLYAIQLDNRTVRIRLIISPNRGYYCNSDKVSSILINGVYPEQFRGERMRSRNSFTQIRKKRRKSYEFPKTIISRNQIFQRFRTFSNLVIPFSVELLPRWFKWVNSPKCNYGHIVKWLQEIIIPSSVDVFLYCSLACSFFYTSTSFRLLHNHSCWITILSSCKMSLCFWRKGFVAGWTETSELSLSSPEYLNRNDTVKTPLPDKNDVQFIWMRDPFHHRIYGLLFVIIVAIIMIVLDINA